MNHRVLELLKTPKSIQSEDLNLLEEEINSFPYVQNIRALYLYGVHLYDKDNYQKVLSTTAAYTTDKKILYQLINGRIQQKPKVDAPAEAIKEKTIPAENPLQILLRSKVSVFPLKRQDETSVGEAKPETDEQPTKPAENKDSFGVAPEPKPESKEVFVKGERNRILFEGEEDFLENDHVETIDLESTLESGSIITFKPEKEVQQDNGRIDAQEHVEKESPDADFTPETLVEEEKISDNNEEEKIRDASEKSFHETESFLPEVNLANNGEKEESHEEQIEESESHINGEAEHNTEFTHETIVDEDKILSSDEEKTITDDAELSFHGTESFLPEIKIESQNKEEQISEIPQPVFSKHEDEMRRLIEEVERKMKEKAASEKVIPQEEPENSSHDISFAETQSFEVKPPEPKKGEEPAEPAETIVAVDAVIKEEEQEENKISDPENTESQEANSAWKPMSFEASVPDSLLNKAKEVQPSETEVPLDKAEEVEKTDKQEGVSEAEETVEPTEENTAEHEVAQDEKKEETKETAQEEKEEVPVMNVSFFGSGWTIAQPEKQSEKQPEKQEENLQDNKEQKAEAKVENIAVQNGSGIPDSNIPGFINTWQSWLKIDRSEESPKDKVEVKNKVIETFIETNPKISQLKEESNFVVKEKGDDISHLMTETLANLYFEQKLYTKAIKAFEILIKKTPEKKEYYEGKIQEIKDFRTKG